MSLYLKTTGESSLAVAVCPRCHFKVKYVDLKVDPNNQQRYCGKCVDLYDPYRLSARQGDKISLQYPRPDEDLVNPDGPYISEALQNG